MIREAQMQIEQEVGNLAGVTNLLNELLSTGIDRTLPKERFDWEWNARKSPT